MGVPRTYRVAGETTLATYDFYDLATGTGYKNFYGVNARIDASNSSYALTTQASIIGEGNGFTSVGNAAWSGSFFQTFEVPITLKGKAILTVPFGFWKTATTDFSSTMTAKLYKTINGTRTQVGSTVSKQYDVHVVGQSVTLRAFTAVFDISKTLFRPNDIIEVYLETTAPGANNTVLIFHNPADIQIDNYPTYGQTTVTSRMTLVLPIKIQQ